MSQSTTGNILKRRWVDGIGFCVGPRGNPTITRQEAISDSASLRDIQYKLAKVSEEALVLPAVKTSNPRRCVAGS